MPHPDLIERIPCRSCRRPFNRRHSEPWKTLCSTCWRWHRTLTAIQEAGRYLPRQ